MMARRSERRSEIMMPTSYLQSPNGRLPADFAASYEYQGECIVDPSHLPSRSTAQASSSRVVSPRKSPRARQSRFSDLSEAFLDNHDDDGNDEEAYRASSNASHSRRRTKTARADSSSDEASRSSSSPKKRKARKRIKRTRDDPNSAAGSIYAHLEGVPDLFAEHNDIMFCGINPGVKSSSSGHHFAHRSNHFYPSLHLAGITAQRIKPEQDVEFPSLHPYALGLTNLAPRPTAEGAELLPSELIEGVPVLIQKIQKWKPRTVCFVGKGIAEAFVKGLKQAGAIGNQSSIKRGRGSHATSVKTSNAKREAEVKLETSDSLPSQGSVKQEADDQPGTRPLQISIPSDILCAFTATSSDEKDVKLAKSSSPQKRKQLYTKGNSKDDTGYGILPICIPHSNPNTHHPLTLDQVTLLFVTPSSSARVTTHFLDDKARILTSLRRLVDHLRDLSTEEKAQLTPDPLVKLEPNTDLHNETPSKTLNLTVVDTFRFSTTDT
ncbi:UDG domain-containing protein [Pseudozyma hubeiensis]|nr:UDG domain-containing protein [Pseudozyma hubeiensis]